MGYIVNGAKSTVDNPPPGQCDGASSMVWMEFQVVGNNPLPSYRIDPDLAAAASQMFGERRAGQLADGTGSL